MEGLKQALKELDKTIDGLKTKIAAAQNREAELASCQKELTDLNELVAKLSSECSIFSDNRLHYLYEQVMGRKDKVENAYGDDFEIIYNSPQDVLIAIIYSCELNK